MPPPRARRWPSASAATRSSGWFSIANLSIVPAECWRCRRAGPSTSTTSPLPRHAGLNAPVWALANRGPTHGIIVHLIEGALDEGDILAQRTFDLAPSGTCLTLNTPATGWPSTRSPTWRTCWAAGS
ncbi:MAG: hypothetical protein IPG17_20060 [Sandaracinaceae bacterium]|nr:hypothetical protein [Sandaracinaceae bacterium]